MLKLRSVPARAESLHSNVRFSLHVLRVFLNASLKNSGNVLFKIKVCPCRNFKSTINEKLTLKDAINDVDEIMYLVKQQLTITISKKNLSK